MLNSDRLDDLLAERGWTRKELATRAGISQSTLSRIENTDRQPQADIRKRLAQALGLRGWSAAALFAGRLRRPDHQ